jgi:hypothetical protein
LNVSTLAREQGVSRTTIRKRLARGWTPPTGWVLLRTTGGALVQPICQSSAGPKICERTCDVIATLPAACRAFDAQHVELAD